MYDASGHPSKIRNNTIFPLKQSARALRIPDDRNHFVDDNQRVSLTTDVTKSTNTRKAGIKVSSSKRPARAR